jgi:hypothetical protein
MFIAGNSSFQIFFPSLSLDDRSLHLLIFVMAPFLFFKNSFFLIKFALCDHDNMGRHEFKTKQTKWITKIKLVLFKVFLPLLYDIKFAFRPLD